MNAWGKWLVLAILLLAAVQLQAVVLNPSFGEYKDVECTGHPDINTDFDISDGYKIPTDFNSIAVNRSQSRPGGQPTGSLNTEWEDAYTWSVEKYVPDPNLVRAAYMLNWKVDKIEPADGDRFVILDSDGKSYGPNKVTLSQTIEVEVGDRIAGQYFFGTYDYDQWADYATISLIPHNEDKPIIEMVKVGVSDVGNEGSMHGWKWFSHIFEEEQAGKYELQFQVKDLYDSLFGSILAIDNLRYCKNAPAYGDINYDCRVDFLDLAKLAKWWLQECDEFSSCNEADLTDQGDVGIDDLQIIAEYWLQGV